MSQATPSLPVQDDTPKMARKWRRRKQKEHRPCLTAGCTKKLESDFTERRWISQHKHFCKSCLCERRKEIDENKKRGGKNSKEILNEERQRARQEIDRASYRRYHERTTRAELSIIIEKQLVTAEAKV